MGKPSGPSWSSGSKPTMAGLHGNALADGLGDCAEVVLGIKAALDEGRCGGNGRRAGQQSEWEAGFEGVRFPLGGAVFLARVEPLQGFSRIAEQIARQIL